MKGIYLVKKFNVSLPQTKVNYFFLSYHQPILKAMAFLFDLYTIYFVIKYYIRSEMAFRLTNAHPKNQRLCKLVFTIQSLLLLNLHFSIYAYPINYWDIFEKLLTLLGAVIFAIFFVILTFMWAFTSSHAVCIILIIWIFFTRYFSLASQ